ncbi:Rhodanese-like domain-containing protein [Lasiosphaeria hispida]|uniref:Rhodanese-like domain-containing protein n=1 Tax=Lasiosphaeria hispida TaxID=260671 RepID=A0AAJ0HBU7_9PEZI|nr:Rhodanese-like domain-containing protein [Lasiosphaeria hispida]
MMASSAEPQNAAPWHAAYPVPMSQPRGMSREAVLEMMKEAVAGKDYILVDLRRADHEGGTIRGSINLPAQSLHPTLSTLYTMFRAAGIRKVLWYCSSSRGRGTRAAGWFSDYLADHGDADIESLVLEGGVTGWAAGGSHYVGWMDGYDESFWINAK